jgi:cysteine desulfuration protein SufE
MRHSIETLTENFALFDDWEERYRYLIDLGRTLPAMDPSLRTDGALVSGCTSRVWLVASMIGGRLRLIVDSDAHIVRGLIALLLAAYDGRPVEDVAQIDIRKFFHDIGLDQHLSPNRRSGFFAMVERVRALSKEAGT